MRIGDAQAQRLFGSGRIAQPELAAVTNDFAPSMLLA